MLRQNESGNNIFVKDSGRPRRHVGIDLPTMVSLGEDMSHATVLLGAIEEGEPAAAEKLLDLVYEELRRPAASKMARETPDQTLQPTELVHKAWLRLIGAENPKFENRAHLFCRRGAHAPHPY
jgi:ECF sigma factor